MNKISIALYYFTPKFKDGGYVMSYVTQRRLYSRIIAVKLANGVIGFGESISDPALDLKTILKKEKIVLKNANGLDLKDLPLFINRLLDKDLTGIRFALETAYADLITKNNGLPLHTYFGGAVRKSIPDYLSISNGSASFMRKAVKEKGKNRKVIQIKLDGKNIDKDLARIDAILNELSKKQTLLIDFNGVLSINRAKIFIKHYKDSRIIWEEPCFTYKENRKLSNITGQKILFDQCMNSLTNIIKACNDGNAAGVCIKPMVISGMSGSLILAKTMIDICINYKIPVRVDGLWCSPIGNATIINLACCVPNPYLISGCNLCEPLIFNENWGDNVTENGKIYLNKNTSHTIVKGHGINPFISKMLVHKKF